MVLKTKSCNLLTTPSRSSPRDAILRVLVDQTALGEFGGSCREARQAWQSRAWCLGRVLNWALGQHGCCMICDLDVSQTAVPIVRLDSEPSNTPSHKLMGVGGKVPRCR